MTRTPAESRVFVNNIEIALADWPGDEPPVFFCHATGFHARIWDQVVSRLAGLRCIAFHGWAFRHPCDSASAARILGAGVVGSRDSRERSLSRPLEKRRSSSRNRATNGRRRWRCSSASKIGRRSPSWDWQMLLDYRDYALAPAPKVSSWHAIPTLKHPFKMAARRWNRTFIPRLPRCRFPRWWCAQAWLQTRLT
jgi:hypothetical protein